MERDIPDIAVVALYLWKYSAQVSATPSCTVPIVRITCCLTSREHCTGNADRKWSATAIKASLGQRWNQSMVQPEKRPGNLRERLRNFSPTYTVLALFITQLLVVHTIYHTCISFTHYLSHSCNIYTLFITQQLVVHTIYHTVVRCTATGIISILTKLEEMAQIENNNDDEKLTSFGRNSKFYKSYGFGISRLVDCTITYSKTTIQ